LKFDSDRKRSSFAIAIALFALGLMSKSVVATLPVSLLVVLWWKRGRLDWKQDVVPLLPFFAIGIGSGLFTAWVEQKLIIAGEESAFALTLVERLLVAGRVVWFYLAKIVWPVHLVFIYPRWRVSQVVWWQYLFPLATLMLAGVVWLLRKRWRAPMAVFLFFTATLFPVMGFFNVYPFRFSFVADHFQYLACAGPVALLVAMVSSLGGLGGGARRVLYVIVLVPLAILTWRQSGRYADAETLYRTTIRQNPDCWLAYNNLGNLLGQSNRIDGAIDAYSKALQINPGFAVAENNLSGALLRSGRNDEAFAHCLKAVEIDPNYADAHHNLGILLEKRGQIDEAIVQYRREVEIYPNHAEAQNKLGNVLAGVGRIDEAIVHYRAALKSNPDYAEAYFNLGNVFAQSGRRREAIEHYLKAVAIRPNYERAHTNLGHALRRAGRMDEAIMQYERALEISASKTGALRNLGSALYENGQAAKAILVLQRGLEAAKSAGSESEAKEIAQYLEMMRGTGF
jgi:tetratricopeptide (TPR) repeat protein